MGKWGNNFVFWAVLRLLGKRFQVTGVYFIFPAVSCNIRDGCFTFTDRYFISTEQSFNFTAASFSYAVGSLNFTAANFNFAVGSFNYLGARINNRGGCFIFTEACTQNRVAAFLIEAASFLKITSKVR